MELDSIERFWDEYIEKTKRYEVSSKTVRWYFKSHLELRLAQHPASEVESYLQNPGRNCRVTDWQFKQAVDALRILFVDMVKLPWAERFQWDFWPESATQLPASRV